MVDGMMAAGKPLEVDALTRDMGASLVCLPGLRFLDETIVTASNLSLSFARSLSSGSFVVMAFNVWFTWRHLSFLLSCAVYRGTSSRLFCVVLLMVSCFLMLNPCRDIVDGVVINTLSNIL